MRVEVFQVLLFGCRVVRCRGLFAGLDQRLGDLDGNLGLGLGQIRASGRQLALRLGQQVASSAQVQLVDGHGLFSQQLDCKTKTKISSFR